MYIAETCRVKVWFEYNCRSISTIREFLCIRMNRFRFYERLDIYFTKFYRFPRRSLRLGVVEWIRYEEHSGFGLKQYPRQIPHHCSHFCVYQKRMHLKQVASCPISAHQRTERHACELCLHYLSVSSSWKVRLRVVLTGTQRPCRAVAGVWCEASGQHTVAIFCTHWQSVGIVM
jgi:hypothetical protein